MNVYPFIEAEKRSGRNVKRACELLKVSRSAFYARRSARPGRPRRRDDAELTEQIADGPRRVERHLRRSARPRRAQPPGPPALRPQAGRPADARAGLQGRHRSDGARPRSPTRPPPCRPT